RRCLGQPAGQGQQGGLSGRRGPGEPAFPGRGALDAAWPQATMSTAEAETSSLTELAAREADCTRCPLYRDATQVVPGEGHRQARMMAVGEQPGDKEDLAGRPFVGPAGRLFDVALEEAGIPRDQVFVTNAVKHFKFEQ